MAALLCPNCKSSVQWTDAGCAGCGARFREVRCLACDFVAAKGQVPKQVCPRCSRDWLAIVPIEATTKTEEVGSEAFVGDIPLADDIERGFSEPKKAAPPTRRAKPEPSRAPDASDAAGRRSRERDDQPPRDEPPPARQEGDRRGTLKRRTWTTPEPEESDEAEEKQKPVKKVSDQPVQSKSAKKTRGLTFEFQMPAGTKRALVWVGIGVSALAAVVLAIYFLDTPAPPNSRQGRGGAGDPGLAVDAGALEAEASRRLQMAVEYYQTHQGDQAVAALQEIMSQFAQTAAAGQAREALDRRQRGEPLFGSLPPEDPPEAAAGPQVAAAAPAAPAAPEKKSVSIGIPAKRPPADSAKDAPEPSVAASSPRGPQPPPQGSTLPKSDAKPRPLPPGFVAVEHAGVHSSGWPIEIICLSDNSHMMLVPPGDFEMGGDATDEPNAAPKHRVKLRTFYIDRYEVTLGRYKHFLEQRKLAKNPYRDLSAAALSASASDWHPVVGMAWRDANAYAQWSGKTLPTEAQWEKAARGTDARAHPWGAGAPVWERQRQPKQIDRVRSFAWDVSVYGCFDMAGNAWEWCADWYDAKYYQSSPAADPDGPTASRPPVAHTEPERVLRGGSPNWRVAWRAPGGINQELPQVGFRCVLDVERVPAKPVVVTDARPVAPTQPQTPVPVRAPPPGGFRF